VTTDGGGSKFSFWLERIFSDMSWLQSALVIFSILLVAIGTNIVSYISFKRRSRLGLAKGRFSPFRMTSVHFNVREVAMFVAILAVAFGCLMLAIFYD
jgi:hypothetical protein